MGRPHGWVVTASPQLKALKYIPLESTIFYCHIMINKFSFLNYPIAIATGLVSGYRDAAVVFAVHLNNTLCMNDVSSRKMQANPNQMARRVNDQTIPSPVLPL